METAVPVLLQYSCGVQRISGFGKPLDPNDVRRRYGLQAGIHLQHIAHGSGQMLQICRGEGSVHTEHLKAGLEAYVCVQGGKGQVLIHRGEIVVLSVQPEGEGSGGGNRVADIIKGLREEVVYVHPAIEFLPGIIRVRHAVLTAELAVFPVDLLQGHVPVLVDKLLQLVMETAVGNIGQKEYQLIQDYLIAALSEYFRVEVGKQQLKPLGMDFAGIGTV